MDPTEWFAVFKVPGADQASGALFPTEGHEKDEDLLSDAGVTQRIHGLRSDMDHNDILHRNLYTVNHVWPTVSSRTAFSPVTQHT